jgi:methionyl-tRNA synthetase
MSNEPQKPQNTPAVPATPAAPTTQPAAAPVAPPAAPSAQAPATITFDDFAKLDLRVAKVLECIPHPNADKLLVLQIELAGGERRQICAGLRAHYQPEQLVGKEIIVVANLAPRMMRGQVSNGMLLAATDPATSKVIIMGPTEPVTPGSKVS